MNKKIIKSKQVGCETPSVSCSCGGDCFSMEDDSYNYICEQGYYCEECGQEWIFPDSITLNVSFKKNKGDKNG
jgi:hypothetical protein